jgi:LacI family transcriptional regulator
LKKGEFAKQITDDHSDVDGVFVITDLVAVGVLAYFNEKKHQSSGKVIGFVIGLCQR